MTLQRRLRVVPHSTMPAARARARQDALKIAFASTDRRTVDQHFGAAQAFAIYGIDPDQSCLIEVIQFDPSGMDGNDGKLGARLDALTGCAIVYCAAVGAAAIAQLRARGIQPIKVPPGTVIAGVLRDLRHDLHNGSNRWLQRAIAASAPRGAARFDRMEAEGWNEESTP